MAEVKEIIPGYYKVVRSTKEKAEAYTLTKEFVEKVCSNIDSETIRKEITNLL